MENQQLALIERADISSLPDTMKKIGQMQAMVQSTLKPDHDFGVIPGTQKPTLLKPGAEKILMMFGIQSDYEILDKIEDWKNGIFAYTVKCTLSQNGIHITSGLGSCNSQEKKYRYRWVRENEVPAYLDKSSLRQNNWGKYQVPNDEIFDQVNTLLKMAKKRAQIDATLTVGSLSEVFTQDIEDMQDFIERESTENMTLDDALKVRMPFGKHKGLSLEEIGKSTPDYITWLAGQEIKQADLRQAVGLIMSASEKKKLRKKSKKQGPQEEQETIDLPPVDDGSQIPEGPEW